MTIRTFTAAALACAAVAACSKSKSNSVDSTAPAAATSTTPATPTTPDSAANANAAAASTPTTMTDANILAKAEAGDSAEVSLGKFMQMTSTNAAVKSFAKLLETDHGKGISKVEATAKKANITMQPPAGDTTSQAAAHTLDRLKTLSGHDLDTAFVNHEIQDHQHDIDETKQLASTAQNADVKKLLEGELPELQKHLDAAQKLSTKLSSSAGADSAAKGGAKKK